MVHEKYVKTKLSHWLRKPKKVLRGISPIWNGFMKLYCWLADGSRWKVGDGTEVAIGIDPIIGINDPLVFSQGLLRIIREKGYFTFNSIVKKMSQGYWMNADDL